METEEYLNRRAIELSPNDSVLFLFNLSAGYNYNNVDVTVSEVKDGSPQGRASVHITGKGNRGLSGIGPVIGSARFEYIRPNLADMGLPNDGTLFDIFRGGPSFLGTIKELTRRTGFNCTADDFDETAFYPDSFGVRRLKAKEGSWRFVGEAVLGRPRREDIGVVMNLPVRANLKIYNGVYFNNIDRLRIGLGITHMQGTYARLKVGDKIKSLTDPLIPYLLNHLHRRGIDAGFSVTPITGINLYGLTVSYKGALREGDHPLVGGVDRSLALTVAPLEDTWSAGEIVLYHNSKGQPIPSHTSSSVTALSIARPTLFEGEASRLLEGAKVGGRLAGIGDARLVAEMFLTVTGQVYSADLHGDLSVTFNGPNRPFDQLPVGMSSARVVQFTRNIPMPSALSGSLKFFYEAV